MDSEKEIIEENILAILDRLLTDGRGVASRVPSLSVDTLIICDLYAAERLFPWKLIEETVDEMPKKIDIIYIGPHFDKLPTKVKHRIFVCRMQAFRTLEVLEKVCLTLCTATGTWTCAVENKSCWYLHMRTEKVRDGKSDKYCPCWTFQTDCRLEDFVVCKSRRYLRSKRLVETNQGSNIGLLRELFALDGDETTPVFQKNDSSQVTTAIQVFDFSYKCDCLFSSSSFDFC